MGPHRGACSAPRLYPLFTHDSVATRVSNSDIKFAGDTPEVGLGATNAEPAYREEVRALVEWCQEMNLSLNVNKSKELIMDYRR